MPVCRLVPATAQKLAERAGQSVPACRPRGPRTALLCPPVSGCRQYLVGIKAQCCLRPQQADKRLKFRKHRLHITVRADARALSKAPPSFLRTAISNSSSSRTRCASFRRMVTSDSSSSTASPAKRLVIVSSFPSSTRIRCLSSSARPMIDRALSSAARAASRSGALVAISSRRRVASFRAFVSPPTSVLRRLLSASGSSIPAIAPLL